MGMYELDHISLHMEDHYAEQLGEEQVDKVVSLFQHMPLPADEVGIVCLDHVIQENGLLLLVAVFNNDADLVERTEAEIHLYNGEKEKVASGLIPKGGLPLTKKGEAHFWHFFLPHEAFLVSDVKLGQYYVEVIPRDEDENLGEPYTFYHIFSREKSAGVAREDTKARITLMDTPIEYTSEVSLEAITKKREDE